MFATAANKAAMLNKYDVCLFASMTTLFLFICLFVCFHILHDNVLREV